MGKYGVVIIINSHQDFRLLGEYVLARVQVGVQELLGYTDFSVIYYSVAQNDVDVKEDDRIFILLNLFPVYRHYILFHICAVPFISDPLFFLSLFLMLLWLALT